MAYLLLANHRHNGHGVGASVRLATEVTGWILLGLFILLCLSFITRIIAVRLKLPKGNAIWKLTVSLKRVHEPIGIAMLSLGVIHGVLAFAHYDLAGWISGIIAMLFAISVFVTYLVRKKYGKWLYAHRILSFVGLIVIAVHILACACI